VGRTFLALTLECDELFSRCLVEFLHRSFGARYVFHELGPFGLDDSAFVIECLNLLHQLQYLALDLGGIRLLRVHRRENGGILFIGLRGIEGLAMPGDGFFAGGNLKLKAVKPYLSLPPD